MNKKRNFKFVATLIVMLVAMCGWSPLFAQSAMEDFITLRIDHWDGQYALGEEVVVRAEVHEPFEAVQEIWINGNLSQSEKRTFSQVGEMELYRSCHNEPTAVMVKLVDPNKQRNFTDIGYCTGMEGIKAGFEKPADFYEWWMEQVAMVRSLPIEAKLTEVDVPDKYAKDYVCYDVEVNCSEGGAPVRGYMAMPKGATAGSLPICIFTHGAGVKGANNRSKIDVALRYAREGGGSIALDINAHGMLNGQPQEYYNELDATTLKNYKNRPVEDRENYYFRGMYLRLQRALDWLCTLPEWDGERVVVLGSSQGGAQTAAIAGLDNRVTHAIIREPGMMDLGGILAGRRSGMPYLVEKYGVTDEFLKWGPYFDTAFFLEHSTAELLYECGWVDMSCTPTSIMVGYNHAKGNKRIYTYPYRRHQSPKGKYKDEWNTKINNEFKKFLKEALK